MAKSKAKSGKFDLTSFLKKSDKFRKGVQKRRAERKFDEYEDGKYLMRLNDVEIGQSKSSNRTQAVLAWKFLEGEYKGKTKRDFRGLEDETGWSFFTEALDRLGYDTDQLDSYTDDIPKILKEINKDKPVAFVTLKTNGDFQNLRVIRLADDEDVEEAESAGDEDEEEEDDDAEEEADEEEEEEEESDEEEEEDEEEESDEEEEEDEEESDEEEEEEEADEEDEDADEDEEEEEESEEVALSVGSQVKVKTADGVKKAEVTDIDEKANTIKVTTKDGKKLKLSAAKIVEVLDTPETPAKGKKAAKEEKPAKKAKEEKVAKKKAKK